MQHDLIFLHFVGTGKQIKLFHYFKYNLNI
jgi:hypothetical protein